MTETSGDSRSSDVRPARTPALATLLERLARDGDAASAYEALRLRLTTYFRLRVPVEAEALADEAIDRLARRLDDGTDVANLAAYALGIARLLVLESGARQRREQHAAREAAWQGELGREEDEADPALSVLLGCLKCLAPESAAFILDYYVSDDGPRIPRRQALADRLGMSMNAVRNRALRIRMGLEKCVREGLRSQDAAVAPVGDEMSKTVTRSDASRPTTYESH